MIKLNQKLFTGIHIVAMIVIFALYGCGDITGSNESESVGGGESYPADNSSDIDIDFNCSVVDKTVTCEVVYADKKDFEIVSYKWDFGDGKFSTDEKPIHTYAKYDLYNITLNLEYKLNGKLKYTVKQKGINVVDKSVLYLFLPNFGDDKQSMYFAIHVKGSSNDKQKGIFTQKGNDLSGKYSESYARDLSILLSNWQQEMRFEFSKYYKDFGLEKLYSIDYGWTDKNGINLDMPFYFGYSKFKVPKSSGIVRFYSFNILDYTSSGFGQGYGYDTFVRCNQSKNFTLNIPIEKYDESIYKNIALFTIEFTDSACTHKVAFDGFVEK